MWLATTFALLEIGNRCFCEIGRTRIGLVLRFKFTLTESIRKSLSIVDNIVTGANHLFSVHPIQKSMPNHKIATDRAVWVFRNLLKTIWRRERLRLRVIAVLQPLGSFSQC